MIMSELRYAVRSLLSSRGFALTAMFTLALGIALATAMYAVVHAVLVRPLPYPDPDRIVAILLEHPSPRRCCRGCPAR